MLRATPLQLTVRQGRARERRSKARFSRCSVTGWGHAGPTNIVD